MIPTLIYCAARNKDYAATALRHGFRYGARLPAFVYHAPYFVDQDYECPDRAAYMQALAKHRPALATVLDWEWNNERQRTFQEVMSWANEAAQYVTEAVIIIPKIQNTIHHLPREIGGKPVRLGFSIPTSYGGTELPRWDFLGWDVHLLGGSPKEQLEHASYLRVKSTDGNYINARASNGQFFSPGSARYGKNRYAPQLQEAGLEDIDTDVNYAAFELSCINIQAAWRGCMATLRFGQETDIAAIKQIANQYSTELGYVMNQSLLRGIGKRELYIAEYDRRVIGFVNWHRRRDGISTIYEIAVHREFRGQNIGKALLAAVPIPVRLKCTVDNEHANNFYAAQGMCLTARESGRKRPLNVWSKS